MLPSSLRIHHVLVYRLYVSKVVLSRLYSFQIIRFLYPCIPGISVPSRREEGRKHERNEDSHVVVFGF